MVYFLAWVKSKEIRPQPEEVSQVKWVEISLAPKWLNYDNDRQLVSRVKAIIKKCY